MSEKLDLREPLYRLSIRFGSGEKIVYVVKDMVDGRSIAPDIRYAIITSVSCDEPSKCTEVVIINMRDVTYIKTERVPLEQVTGHPRTAGIMAGDAGSTAESLIKSVAQIKFV